MNASRAVLLICGGLALLIVICVVGAFDGWRGFLQAPAKPVPAIAVPSNSIDPLNEARLLSVQGKLEYAKAPFDDELSIRVDDAVVLFRRVEMFQWQESCVAGSCTQSPDWADEWIDTSTFLSRLGHSNPNDFPFVSRQFNAEGIQLGAFKLESDLIIAQIEAQPRPLRLSELPANLAASASELEGLIFLGNDPMYPVVGDLRIGYTIIRRLWPPDCVQTADHLVATPSTRLQKSDLISVEAPPALRASQGSSRQMSSRRMPSLEAARQGGRGALILALEMQKLPPQHWGSPRFSGGRRPRARVLHVVFVLEKVHAGKHFRIDRIAVGHLAHEPARGLLARHLVQGNVFGSVAAARMHARQAAGADKGEDFVAHAGRGGASHDEVDLRGLVTGLLDQLPMRGLDRAFSGILGLVTNQAGWHFDGHAFRAGRNCSTNSSLSSGVTAMIITPPPGLVRSAYSQRPRRFRRSQVPLQSVTDSVIVIGSRKLLRARRGLFPPLIPLASKVVPMNIKRWLCCLILLLCAGSALADAPAASKAGQRDATTFTEGEVNEITSIPVLRRMLAGYEKLDDKKRLGWTLARLSELNPDSADLRMALAITYAMQGDKSKTYDLLLKMKEQGYGVDLSDDPRFEKVHGTEAWNYVVENLKSNLKPFGEGKVAFTLPKGDTLFESIAWDPKRGKLLVGSVREGKIYLADKAGKLEEFISPADGSGLWSVYAMATDPARDLLYVTSASSLYFKGFRQEDFNKVGLFKFQLSSGKLLHKYLLPTNRARAPCPASRWARMDRYSPPMACAMKFTRSKANR